jgi:hypothetical protein
MYGPGVTVAETAMVGEVMVTSIVEAFPDAGSMRVPRFGVVIRQALGSLIRASWIDFPALLSMELGSHSEWWPLKSPPTTKGLVLFRRFSISSVSQSAFGT